MILDTWEEKCQAETVKEALKSLSESQWHTVDVRFLNVHAFSLEIHPSDISDLKKEMKEELMSVNAVCQQSSKVVPQWKTTQNSASWIQKKQQQKDAKLLLIKTVWKGIYYEMQKLQESVILQKISLNINVNKDNCQFEVKKFNSKTAITISTSELVRAPVFTCMMEQAAVANWIAEKIADQKIHSFTH